MPAAMPKDSQYLFTNAQDFKAWVYAQGSTVGAIADLLDVHLQTLYRWMNGTTEPPSWTILSYAAKGIAFTHTDVCPCTRCYTRQLAKTPEELQREIVLSLIRG